MREGLWIYPFHARAKQLLHGICDAASRTKALTVAKAFVDGLAGHPKTVQEQTDEERAA